MVFFESSALPDEPGCRHHGEAKGANEQGKKSQIGWRTTFCKHLRQDEILFSVGNLGEKRD